MFRCFLVTLVALTRLAGAACLPAEGASLQRADDGRIIITLSGERMAFREADADHVGFSWDNNRKELQFSQPDSCLGPSGRKIGETGTSLKGWINASPEVARCIEQTFPDHAPAKNDRDAEISVNVNISKDFDKLYPGGIDAGLLEPGDRRGYTLNIVLHDFWYRDIYRKFCESFAADAEFDFGFRGSRNVKDKNFVLPANARLGEVKSPICFSCWLFPAEALSPRCQIMEVSADGEIGVRFSWTADPFDQPPQVLKYYDISVRDIAQSIFIDRPSGDFQ